MNFNINAEELENLKNFIISNLSFVIIVIVIGLFIYYLIKPEKFLLLSSSITRVFANFSSHMSKKTIENKLKGTVLEASKNIHKEINEFLPYKIEVQWVEKKDRASFLDSDEIYICMDHSRTETQNIVWGLNDYISEGLFAGVKVHIDKIILKSSRLVLTRKLLKTTYQKGLNYFLENIFNNELDGKEEIQEMTEKLIRLDESGMFVQILLKEFDYHAKQYVVGRPENENFIIETRNFTEFLYNISQGNSDRNESGLIFNKRYFKVSIGLIADLRKFADKGHDFYVDKFTNALGAKVNSIYLCSRGERCIKITKQVKNSINNLFPDLPEPKIYEYKMDIGEKNTKGIVIAYNNLNYLN